MENENKLMGGKKAELREFSIFFLKYVNSSPSFDEAFRKAVFTYRKIFDNVPYANCQSFLSDFYKIQNES